MITRGPPDWDDNMRTELAVLLKKQPPSNDELLTTSTRRSQMPTATSSQPVSTSRNTPSKRFSGECLYIQKTLTTEEIMHLTI